MFLTEVITITSGKKIRLRDGESNGDETGPAGRGRLNEGRQHPASAQREGPAEGIVDGPFGIQA
jgi:hypothetical protein